MYAHAQVPGPWPPHASAALHVQRSCLWNCCSCTPEALSSSQALLGCSGFIPASSLSLPDLADAALPRDCLRQVTQLQNAVELVSPQWWEGAPQCFMAGLATALGKGPVCLGSCGQLGDTAPPITYPAPLLPCPPSLLQFWHCASQESLRTWALTQAPTSRNPMPRQLIFSFLPEIVDVFCSKILENRFPGNNTYLTKSSREKQLSKSCREMCVHFSCLSLNYKNHSWPRINLLHITKGNVFHFLIGWECGSRWTELKKKKPLDLSRKCQESPLRHSFWGIKCIC